MKQEATQEVIAAIRAVLAGEIYLSHRMAARLLRKFTATKPAATRRAFSSLTDRELEVLELLGSGLSPNEIADKLKLSVKTIETYREHLKSKLGLANAPQLIQYARAGGCKVHPQLRLRLDSKSVGKFKPQFR